MFDFLKNLTKSDEEKQQEAFSAYLDDTLSLSQRREFEALLAEDADLRAEMELAQLIRRQMNEMPRRSVPRSFTLDPAVYGAPQKEPLVQAYPFLRAATVLTAFFFVIALGLSVFTMQGSGDMASSAQTAMEPAPALDAPLAESEVAIVEATEEPVAAERIDEGIITEEVIVEEEAMEDAAEVAPLPTMTIALTKSTELEAADEAASEADGTTNAAELNEDSAAEPQPGAPAGAGGEAAAPTPTVLATATVSSLPRPEITETAVPRIVESPPAPPDEIADAVGGETTDAETFAVEEPPQSQARGLSTSQIVLIGLGILLLVLIAVTLLARRKI